MKVIVDISDAKVSNSTNDVIITYSLGSCIGVTLYDARIKAGGMLHYQLPSSKNEQRSTRNNPLMYADSGMDYMLDRLRAMGANMKRMSVKIAGGAQMLIAPGLSDRFNVGQRNVDMTQTALAQHHIRVAGCDTGGTQGRTMRLFVATGELKVRFVTGEIISL